MKSCTCNNKTQYLLTRYIGVLCLLIMGLSCLEESVKVRQVHPAFYYWKSYFKWSSQQEELLQHLETRSLYIKLFDVDWVDEWQRVLPVATLTGKHNIPKNANIVPTIYITNRVFYHLQDSSAVDSLVERVQKGVRNLWKEDSSATNWQIKQLQFDCDWTQQTQTAYFYFLHQMKKFTASQNWELSATIRLHQIKYKQQTGIPPVDRGLLMFYNTGSVNDYQEKNAILDMATASQYTSHLPKYPLELDLALPLFSWAVVFRKKKFQYLVNHLRLETLSNHSDFQNKNGTIFSVTKNTYIKNTAFQKGDEVRIEQVSPTLLQESVQHLRQYWPNDSLTLAFYHLDSLTLQPYTHETLQQLVQNFAGDTTTYP